MSDTVPSFTLANPEDVPARLAETQIVLLQSIQLNLQILKIVHEMNTGGQSDEIKALFDRGFKLFDRAYHLTQGKPDDD